MKTRTSFVANSSSSSFVITNTTKKTLTMEHFVEENKHLAEEFCKQYNEDVEIVNSESLVESFNSSTFYDATFKPGKSQTISFGDEDGPIIGRVFDYMLRNVNESKSFKWYMCECRGAEWDAKGNRTDRWAN